VTTETLGTISSIIDSALAVAEALVALTKSCGTADPNPVVAETLVALAEEEIETDPKPVVAKAADAETFTCGVTDPKPVEQEALAGIAWILVFTVATETEQLASDRP
jgi:hypothetical protein